MFLSFEFLSIACSACLLFNWLLVRLFVLHFAWRGSDHKPINIFKYYFFSQTCETSQLILYNLGTDWQCPVHGEDFLKVLQKSHKIFMIDLRCWEMFQILYYLQILLHVCTMQHIMCNCVTGQSVTHQMTKNKLNNNQ